MSKRQVVGSMSEWSGVLKDFWRQIDDGSLGRHELQLLLQYKNELSVGFCGAFLAEYYQYFYRDVFGFRPDFSELVIEHKKSGFDRLLIMAQGLTPERLYNQCQELFRCDKWTGQDLGKIVISERTAKNGPYPVWFRNRVEADEELRNLSSFDVLKKNDFLCITLEERLFFELKVFNETGKHLDSTGNIGTFCGGSRYSNGGVPFVRWDNHKMFVGSVADLNDPSAHFIRLRPRQAVV